GTVGANKNSIKISGEYTDLNAQGYFVYDSKNSGALTVSHLRFGPKAIRAPYLISGADFVACHHLPFVESIDILTVARPGATLLLNAYGDAEAVWARLPREMQQRIIDLQLEVYALDASKVARAAGMPGQINTVMQTAFFALSKVLPRDEAIGYIKTAILKTYGRKGEAVVAKNNAAVDGSLAALVRVPVPAAVAADAFGRPPIVPPAAPEFVQRVTARMMAGEGDLLPVSAFIPDGTWPVGTTKFEKRRLAELIPQWDASLCIQCNKCVLVCPHAVIRANACPQAALADAPEGFQSAKLRSAEVKDHAYTLQVSAADCTGCSLCHEVCPARDKSDLKRKALMMVPAPQDYTADQARWDFFEQLPEPPAALLQDTVKGSQFRAPKFEFSGACAGCGETPYIKLLTQLFGDHLVVANATGCSSIYGGNLPTTPYTTDRCGRGPAWSNSLFEDNAEYGLGLRAGLDQFSAQAKRLLGELAPELPADLVATLSAPETDTDADRATRRAAVERLRPALAALGERPEAVRLAGLADNLVEKSVWIVGGDGWAYDIDFGGLDHVLASNKKVRILVLDTEVYSNTGGQNSKSTPMGAVAKFAAGGKASDKKDMAMIAAQYGHVYVARVAMGAKDSQTVQAFLEAEAHPGPAIIIAYAHCIAHGIRMAGGLTQQKLAVDSGHWQLMRHNPLNAAAGKPVTSLDSPATKVPLKNYTANELRYQVLRKIKPERADELADRAQAAITVKRAGYETLAAAGQPAPVAEASATPETTANA
ncbi:MAG: pyruvate:ferredoxin (flavodoxin) oxidoreductase, partial [Verrucomicrobiota bacterium]